MVMCATSETATAASPARRCYALLVRGIAIAATVGVLLVSTRAEAEEPAGVRVVFEPSEPNVVLEKRVVPRRGDQVDSEGMTAICVAGCDVTVDPKATYQIGGTWVTPASFQLPPGQPGPFRIRATPGSSRSDGIGTGLVLAGGGAFVLGGSALLVLFGTGATKNMSSDSTASHLLTASITTTAVGLLLIALSLPFRGAGATRVSVEPLPKE
jgi:hypothetical protein